jgi:hypothetical protein
MDFHLLFEGKFRFQGVELGPKVALQDPKEGLFHFLDLFCFHIHVELLDNFELVLNFIWSCGQQTVWRLILVGYTGQNVWKSEQGRSEQGRSRGKRTTPTSVRKKWHSARKEERRSAQ